MANTYFQFKHFIIHQDRCAMKVTTDACLFGAWAGVRVGSQESGVGSQESGVGSQESGVGLARRSLCEGGSRERGLPTGALTKAGIKKILDIGAGTGLLSLMLAQKDPSVIIDAIEMDEAAAEQARENVSVSPWADRIRIIHADARDCSFTGKYSIIISNPPFYEKEMKADNVKKNMARHNETLLLHELLYLIKNHLEPDGRFFLLLPYKRQEEIRELLLRQEMTIREIQLVRPSAAHGFFRMMLMGKLKETPASEIRIGEISVRDENNNYTTAFIELLKDFYLHL